MSSDSSKTGFGENHDLIISRLIVFCGVLGGVMFLGLGLMAAGGYEGHHYLAKPTQLFETGQTILVFSLVEIIIFGMATALISKFHKTK